MRQLWKFLANKKFIKLFSEDLSLAVELVLLHPEMLYFKQSTLMRVLIKYNDSSRCCVIDIELLAHIP
jgi:hypothetical protein